jgi:hypothetical protein
MFRIRIQNRNFVSSKRLDLGSVIYVIFLFQLVPFGMLEHGAAGGEILLRQLRERSHATL